MVRKWTMTKPKVAHPQPEQKKNPSELLSSAAGADGVEEKDDTAEPLTSLFGGIGPEEIPEFRRAQELIPAYQLLRGLIGRNELDFLIRAAALEALVACGRASFSLHELNEALYWLSEYGRDRTVRALREAGWLEYQPGAGDIVTSAGSQHMRSFSSCGASSRAAISCLPWPASNTPSVSEQTSSACSTRSTSS